MRYLLCLTASALAIGDYCPLDLIDDPAGQLIRAPNSTAGWADWLQEITQWRTACREKVGYNGSIYNVNHLKWTQNSYIQPQSHTYDRYFWDDASHSYTVQRWLQDLRKRYGGIDSVSW